MKSFWFCLFFASLYEMGSTSSLENVENKASNSLPESDALFEYTQIQEILRKLQKLEEWKDDITNEVKLIREAVLRVNSAEPQNRRIRRDASPGAASLPGSNTDCLPGTLGCPLQVTPYSAGSSCILCPDGPRGYPGPAGPPGRDGRDAIAVITTSEVSSTSNRGESYAQKAIRPSNSSGAVYVRWGHHDCPSSAEMIYTGTAATPSHRLAGGGVDQLCLPENPVYDSPVGGVGGTRAFLYGLEYQIDTFPALAHKAWHDVPCAVCKATSRFAKLMIPGTNVCPSTEWTREYSGYLMTERTHAAHHRSLHICVDREMQVLDRTSTHVGDNNEGLLNLVESRCSAVGGGIPCGPYVDGYEVTCAVCTQ